MSMALSEQDEFYDSDDFGYDDSDSSSSGSSIDFYDHGDYKDGRSAEEVEELTRTMDLATQQLGENMTREEVQRLKYLDEKHSAFYFRKMKKSKGPPPTEVEQQEYQQSIPIRLRAIEPILTRLILVGLGDADYLFQNWGLLEKTYADVNTYPYAWIGILMKDVSQIDHSLMVIHILLAFATALLTKPMYKNPRKALKVLNLSKRAVDQTIETAKQLETGPDKVLTGENSDLRMRLSYQEYKQDLYSSLAFATLGQSQEAVAFFRSAADTEQGHRTQAFMEYKDLVGKNKKRRAKKLERFMGHVSVLQLISEELSIPRQHLDETYSWGDRHDDAALEKTNDEDLWRCLQSAIQSFGLVGHGDAGTDGSGKPIRVKFCYKCWATPPNIKLKRCTQCRKVSYCSRNCQLNDWKSHKRVCEPSKQQLQSPSTLISTGKIATVIPEED